MAQPISMTTEQLRELIEAVRATAVNAATAAGNAAAATKPKSGISNCQHRFGGARNHAEVEEFITQVVTYKELEDISDEEALKGLSLLLFGFASIWWQGIRKQANTWNDAIALIREHFSPTKPSYQVYVEIFEAKQDDNTPIDTYVCNQRALLAQLPEGRHDEETELDFVYGLLNIKYRKHITRDDIKTFRELLEKGRIIEHNNQETQEATKNAQRGGKHTKRCTYCNFRGHTAEECRKKTQAQA